MIHRTPKLSLETVPCGSHRWLSSSKRWQSSAWWGGAAHNHEIQGTPQSYLSFVVPGRPTPFDGRQEAFHGRP